MSVCLASFLQLTFFASFAGLCSTHPQEDPFFFQEGKTLGSEDAATPSRGTDRGTGDGASAAGATRAVSDAIRFVLSGVVELGVVALFCWARRFGDDTNRVGTRRSLKLSGSSAPDLGYDGSVG
ncbi:uncharacterized protein NECHADRAFT_123335 [Fusarium vanettenii 77-13-4]|uniref:Uncharacterized protein n=1 Tax=Fusarium vanettenii (strain ATCC MYA-4622 / CBS 123669 / FGSC 9596 / NRRL 45880 / 77-13-4) TaxID=660122 RepID=C7Z858_FUSV7|nr:uncharacterized protein NECHADRAFT_123335 [Fusarium vanettenii 77-13-4]EEU39811.1 predicted protein [Fusarium vanettenii 77-13-4]